MSKTITLTLKKSLIMEAVKADTYQSGQVDKAEDPVKNASLAFSEQAGDETYQERMLTRMLRSGLAKFAASLAEFVDTENGGIDYTFSNTETDQDTITITVIVSSRYNNGLAKPLSSFAEDFIVYSMCYTWWQSKKPSLAKDYLSYAQDALSYVRLCLAKTAPAASSSDYTEVTGSVS